MGDIDFDGRSVLSWNPTADIPLIEVAYEGDIPSGESLVLKFARPITYTVRSAPDLRSIVVTIHPEAAEKKAATTTPPPYTAPAAQPAMPTAPPTAMSTGKVDLSHPYVINLLSSVGPISPASLPMPDIFRGRRLYTTQFEKDGKRWNRLRLGFFPTAGAARDALGSISTSTSYSGAWVAKASATERQASAATEIQISVAAAPPTPPAPKTPAKQAAADQALPAGGLAKLMDEAAVAITAGNYRRAVLLYTKVLQYPDQPTHQQPQELLGLARERNGQLAHAKAEYETYLRLYPEGKGADRVRQRLAGLLTARSSPQEKLRTAPRKKNEWQSSMFTVLHSQCECHRRHGGNRKPVGSEFRPRCQFSIAEPGLRIRRPVQWRVRDRVSRRGRGRVAH